MCIYSKTWPSKEGDVNIMSTMAIATYGTLAMIACMYMQLANDDIYSNTEKSYCV